MVEGGVSFFNPVFRGTIRGVIKVRGEPARGTALCVCVSAFLCCILAEDFF